jgi:quinol monooxygenase YgiN
MAGVPVIIGSCDNNGMDVTEGKSAAALESGVELMADEIVSIAVMEPFAGKEDEFLETLRQLYTLMREKNYSRDQLLRNRKNPQHFFNIRHWTSEEARQEAHEDPAVHRFWAKLGHLCSMRAVYESLDVMDWQSLSAAGEKD